MAAEWTWLVYMAGDNNLEGAGRSDLKEMQKVGSTDKVKIVVQFDTEENKTTRYLVGKGKLEKLQTMPGVDAGDPNILADFLKWGITNYPADHYLVDIWNHGGGWKDLPEGFDYNSIRTPISQRAAKLARVKRSVFRSTIKKLGGLSSTDRAIAIDCGSHDYLDNQELRKAFENAMPNGKKFDILACDACLMNMFEIAYEMKDTSDLMVGSEETEPGEGWPYDKILKQLVDKPDMTPEDLAKVIVIEYGKSYESSGESVTHSALDLRNTIQLAKAIDDMSSALMGKINEIAKDISWSRENSQAFYDPEYIDLGDFAYNIGQNLSQYNDIKAAADQVQRTIDGSFVIKNVANGSVKLAKGVSVYFPSDRIAYAPDYSDLRFSADHKWGNLIKGFLEKKNFRVR